MNKKSSLLRSVTVGLGFLVILVVLAYGFNVTNVDFAETQSEQRLASFTRILRALAHPRIFEYEYEEVDVEIPFYLGCPEGGVEIPEVDRFGAYIIPSQGCAEPKETITVEGYNFQANSSGPINFIGFSVDAPEGIRIQIGNFQADAQGNFVEEVEIPNRTVKEEPQGIAATGRVRVGMPMLSRDAIVTWEKIVETVFMALLATTFGTLIAVPISFFAARNLMSEIKIPLSNIAFSLIGWPLGLWLGSQGAKLAQTLIKPAAANLLLLIVLAVLLPVGAYFLVKWNLAKQQEDKKATFTSRTVNLLITMAAAILVVLAFLALGQVLTTIGIRLTPNEDVPLYFLRRFVRQVGELTLILVPALTALIGGGVIGGLLGNIGQIVSDRINPAASKIINLIVTPLAFALIAVVIMQGVDWFYQFNNPAITLWWPAAIGVAIGLALALLFSPKRSLPIGIVIYGILRTILNGTRSVEALVMAIVFVTWVGLGPFAGALALGLHTVAALAKLYSEQVESIAEGPLEAVQATGANRLQTIVFAVVPQIIPPYISFTMYRWDINVRMSTIIGFVGGGGIGFVLQQNVNLLNYRAASVNMLAIAIVVATMDYISSSLRERFV